VLVEYLDELNMMRSTLKSEKGISNIIYFYREKHDEVDNFHSEFASYIQVTMARVFRTMRVIILKSS
jgi:hypothetical protein